MKKRQFFIFYLLILSFSAVGCAHSIGVSKLPFFPLKETVKHIGRDNGNQLSPPVDNITSEQETTIITEETDFQPPIDIPLSEPIDLSKTIFLTFDDGPSRGKTEKILKTLKEYDIKATFFTVGLFVDYYPATVKQIVDEGHILGCHSYSHDYPKLYNNKDDIINDLLMWEASVKNAIGSIPESSLYRFPGGTTCYSLSLHNEPQIFRDVISDHGYKIFDWNVATNDLYLVDKKEEQTMSEYFIHSLKFTLSLTERFTDTPKILLMHDTSSDTVEHLPLILDYLIEQGYSFNTLNNLPDSYIVAKWNNK